ncbi:MAG TPA: GNAT family N-acetyltransferase [Jiangellaceae bacterium]|nr:GNAT family N-acetyltransferase [Jiangellaceae bacterium]
MLPFELRGDGVLLATPTSADVDAITELCQDKDIQRWTTVPVPYERSHAEQFLTQLVEPGWESGRNLTWALRNPENRSVLGMVSLNLRDHRGSGEIGFWLGSAGRGRGLMTTAVRLVAEYAFAPEGLGLERIVWRAGVGNWASRRVAWRLGFTIEGTLRKELPKRGERVDAWFGTLIAGDPVQPKTRWLDVPTLTGSKVVLRRFVESDADACVEACNDPVTRKWLGQLPSPYTRDTALGYIRSRENEHADGTALHWAAAPVGGGPATGAFSLMGIRDGRAEVGYWVHPAARKAGVATEAVRLMVQHAFTDPAHGGLGLRRLVLARAEGNDASGTVAERADFRPYGVEHQAEQLGDGTWADLHWYELLNSSPR